MSRTVRSVTCLGCGCACDDIEVVIDGERIADTRQTCELGAAWFAQAPLPDTCYVTGRAVSTSAALDAVAILLKESGRPLIYLSPELSCDAQREAVALADALGAAIDSISSSPAALAGLVAGQEEGRISATLGEVRNRADVLVFWGADPTATHPRFWSRYAPEPSGRDVPEGRRSRRLVAVDIGERPSPGDADVRLTIGSGDEAAVLSLAAAMIVKGAAEAGPYVHTRPIEAGPSATEQGEASARVSELATRFASAVSGAKYVAMIADGESTVGRGTAAAVALVKFVRALNDVTRAALITLRGGGNRSGADNVLTWQTGFPVAVDFARGYPEYRPFDGTATARLTRHATDAVLVIGAPARLSPDMRAHLFAAPCAVIGPLAGTPDIAAARAAIDTGIAGIHEGGLAYRMDDVPVRLQAVIGGRPSAAALLRELRQRCLA